jgi:hypothetical protein
MHPGIAELISKIKSAEEDVEREFEKRRALLRVELKAGRVVFEKEALLRHRQFKTSVLNYLAEAKILTIVTAPFIYAVIVPLALLDLFVTVYQAVCFPVYGLAKVRRADYLVFDRHRLAYLNGIEKLNCLYCSYASGFISYAREIISRTEQYWCPIKHAQRILAAHGRYHKFTDFGDAEAYRRELESLRREIREINERSSP